MAAIYTITQLGNCNIRTSPSLSSKSTGKVRTKGTVWTSSERVEDGPRYWFKDAIGWTSSGSDYKFMKVSSSETKPTPNPTPTKPPPKEQTSSIDKTATITKMADFKVNASDHEWLTKGDLLIGVSGLPFQFLNTTDIRLSEYNPAIKSPYGKMYSKRILDRMPLLMLSPGRPKFLEGYSKETRISALTAMSSVKRNIIDRTQFGELLNGVEGRVYTFEFAYKEYYEKLNILARATATYLGIGKVKYNGIMLEDYDWGEKSKESYKSFFSSGEVVPFYVEGENSVSESIGNNSRTSSLDGTLKGISEQAKEAEFYLGNAGLNMAERTEAEVGQDRETVQKVMKNWFDFLPHTLVNRISEGSTTLISGGKLDFPEIFGDTSFSKEYSVKLKFISPYGSTLSIFIYTIMPLLRLLALTIPIQISDNSYGKPFLVRGFLKSVFSVDLGLITGLSFNKGGDSGWNVDHLPTQIDVDLNIKDLYSGLYLPNRLPQFLNNTLMMDFIANLCGVDISKIEIDRKIDMWLDSRFNLIQDIPRNIARGFEEGISNILRQFLGR